MPCICKESKVPYKNQIHWYLTIIYKKEDRDRDY